MPTPATPASSAPWWNDASLRQGATLLTLTMGFIMPGTAAWSFVFYITAIPVILWSLWRGWRPKLYSLPLTAMLGLWLWSFLAITWDHNVSGFGNGHLYWLRNALCTLVFLLNFVSAIDEAPRMRERVISVLIYGAAFNAVVSLALFLIHGDLTDRLWGWGISRNPVLGATTMDISLVLALIRANADARQRPAMAAAALLILGYLALCYSRGALAALAVAMLLIFLGARPLLATLAGMIGIGVTLTLWKFGAVLAPTLWANVTARGADCHVLIWDTAWHAILVHPIVGFGPSARLPITPSSGPYCPFDPSPHDLYLSLLYYSGGIGFGLFVAAVVLLWRHLHVVTHGVTRRLWLALGLIPLVAGLSDLTQVIKGPSPLWYIIWLPMLLVATLPLKTVQSSGSVAS